MKKEMGWIPTLGGPTELGIHQKKRLFKDFQAARNRQEMANNVSDMDCSQLVRQKLRATN